MNDTPNSRRVFLTRLGIGAGVVALLQACGKKEGASETPAVSCNDVSGLNEGEKTTRAALKYVDVTPDEKKRCDGCTHYIAPEAGAACGTCKLIKGPVAPAGHCTGFVAKA